MLQYTQTNSFLFFTINRPSNISVFIHVTRTTSKAKWNPTGNILKYLRILCSDSINGSQWLFFSFLYWMPAGLELLVSSDETTGSQVTNDGYIEGEEKLVQLEEQETKADSSDPECKHWKRTLGHCAFGSDCKFKHSAISVVVSSKKAVIRDPISGKRKRQRPRNKGRAGEFRRWLISNFGLETLQQGSGILDIAGGKGEISFELLNLNDCPSTIIDPRNFIDYSRFKRKLLKGFYHRNEALNANFNQSQIPHSETDIRIPRHVKCFWGPPLWECLSLCLDSPCSLDDYDGSYSAFRSLLFSQDFVPSQNLKAQFLHAKQFMWTDKGLQTNQKGETSDTKEAKEENEVVHQCEDAEQRIEEDILHYDTWGWAELRELLENCSCIVGMHPDQAAEGIVDFALRMKKPFALIPCCVYSKQFPRKKTPSGAQVSNYQDLVDHLRAKHPDIRTMKMPFEGKNTIVYWNPNEETKETKGEKAEKETNSNEQNQAG